MGHDRVLRTCLWHIAAVIVVVGIVVSATQTVPIAAGQETRPERLWDAYPLDPGQEGAERADPAPTPTAAPTRRTGSPSRATGSEGDGGVGVTPVLIGAASPSGSARASGPPAAAPCQRRAWRGAQARARSDQRAADAAREAVRRRACRGRAGATRGGVAAGRSRSAVVRFALRPRAGLAPVVRPGRARSTGSPDTSSPVSAPWWRRPAS
jgi:hypothetical protein